MLDPKLDQCRTPEGCKGLNFKFRMVLLRVRMGR